jgi:hypothetical protein
MHVKGFPSMRRHCGLDGRKCFGCSLHVTGENTIGSELFCPGRRCQVFDTSVRCGMNARHRRICCPGALRFSRLVMMVGACWAGRVLYLCLSCVPVADIFGLRPSSLPFRCQFVASSQPVRRHTTPLDETVLGRILGMRSGSESAA